MLLTSAVAFSEEEVAATAEPTPAPTAEPTAAPTAEPTPTPTAEPTPTPTPAPTAEPTPTPSPAAVKDAVQEEPPAAPALSFDADNLTYKLSDIGDDFDYVGQFTLTIENAADETLVWSTGDGSVAAFVTLDKKTGEAATAETPDEDKEIAFRAYKAGTVTVRAKLAADESVYDEFTLKLEEDPVVHVYSVSLSDQTLALDVGATKQLTATLYEDEIPIDVIFAWSSDNAAVASVAGGLVTAVGKGKAKVTASVEYAGVTYAASCDVTATIPLKGISAAALTFYSDGTATLVVAPDPADADYDPANLQFAVESEYAAYIAVTAGGTVSAVTANGLLNTAESSVGARVKITYGALTAYASVTVYQAATSISIEDDARTVWLNKTAALGVEVLPENAYDAVASYASSDTALFTIDESGLIAGIGLGSGTAIVTMRSGRTANFPVFVLQGTTSLRITVPSGNLRIGETAQMTLTREPQDAVDEISWESSDERYATVDENGLVTLILPGSVTITATSESGQSTSVGLAIIRPAAGLTFYDEIFALFTGYCLAQGQSVTPVVAVLPADATYAGYALSSSDEAVARVDAGKVYGVAVGTATITVTSEDREVSRTFAVKVVAKSKAIKSISVSRSSVSLKEGTKYRLRASINSGAQSKTVLWASLDSSIATVSSAGMVKGIAPGTTYVYAMGLSGIYKRVKVKVSAQLPTNVRLNKSSIVMYADNSYQLNATIYPSNVLQEGNRVLIWKTSNKYVAVVSDDGMVYAISPGTAYITAVTVNGKAYRCRVTVKKVSVKSVTIENPYGQFLVGGTYALNAVVSPSTATNTGVTWSFASSSYKKLATINAKTGEIYCKKPGKIKVTATAKDGSRKRSTITLKIAAVPLNSFSLTRDGVEIGAGAQIELPYKSSFTAVAAVDPALFLEWSSTDARVASVKDGLVTATGAGTATITATAGGLYDYSFQVTVPRDDSQPTYRALVVAQYTSSSATGYLPFAKNTQKGLYNALSESVIGGSRYNVSYRTNLTSAAQLTDAISATFADAKERDVSFIYLLSHGTYSDGSYVWHLYGSGTKGATVSASTIISAMKGVKGHVVLVIPSCYSGGDETIPSTLTYMVRAADQAAADGTSYSGIFASDGLTRASFFDTAESRSYDFFTYSMCKALGWDYLAGSAVGLAADKDSDGYVTISELASTTKSLTAETLEAYFKTYGSSSYFGPPSKSQNVTYYVSPDAASLAIFGK